MPDAESFVDKLDAEPIVDVKLDAVLCIAGVGVKSDAEMLDAELDAVLRIVEMLDAPLIEPGFVNLSPILSTNRKFE